MVIASTKMGPKGQVVIPKLFRKEYGFVPGSSVQLLDCEEGILIKRSKQEGVDIFLELSQQAKEKGVLFRKLNIKKLLDRELEERFNDLS